MKVNPAKRLNHISEYFFSKKGAEVKKLKDEGKEIINLSIGSPDLPPPPEVVDELANTVRTADCHGYQPHKGTDVLRKAWADWYKNIYNADIDPKGEVLPLLGSKEGVFYVMRTFVNPGEKVLLPNPGYPAYTGSARLNDVEPVYYGLTKENNYQPDFGEIEKAGLDGVKLMFVNYPHMPTGALAQDGLYENLIEFGKKHNILVVHDNPYSVILTDETKRKSIMQYPGAMDTAIELNSLSKTFNMAGWRVGTAVGNAELLGHMLKVTSNIHSGMFLPVQKAGAKALALPAEWYSGMNEIYRKRKELVFRLLDNLGLEYSHESAGMFVWSEAPDSITDIQEFLDKLLYEKGIYLTPGIIFGSNGSRNIRCSLCASSEDIKKAIKLTS